MTYRIEFAKAATKAYDKLSTSRRRLIDKKIDDLANNPRPRGCKKLSGNAEFYRIRSGDYRILYQIADRQLLVLVVKLGHRRDIYN